MTINKIYNDKDKLFQTLRAPVRGSDGTHGGGSDMEEPTGLGVQHVEQSVIAATGGELTFTVHPGSMDDWTITFLDADDRGFETLDWVQLSKASGSGETKVTATVAANAMGWQREATIIVNAGDRKIPIVQTAPPYFRVTPEELTGLPVSEGSDYIARTLTVESNIRWYAVIVHDDVNSEPTAPWVSFLPGNAATHADTDTPDEGDASLDLSILNWDQIGGNPRTAKVRFYSPDGSLLQEVPVSQNPLSPYFCVTPSDLTGLPWSTGRQNMNRTLEVESNIEWYAVLTRPGAEPWILFAGSTDNYGSQSDPRHGNAQIGLNIGNYTDLTTVERTATVTFYGANGEVLATVPASQAPRPWLRIDKQPERATEFMPDIITIDESHDMTVEASLFNSDAPHHLHVVLQPDE